MLSRNFKKIIVNVIWLMLLLVSFSLAQIDITIDVAPNVLNLQNNAQVVTVHTDIAYGVVQASKVYLNNVAISSWKSDLRGNFVAKFKIDEIKKLPLAIGEYNTLTLTGTTSDNSFTGSQDILVVSKTARVK